MSKPRKGEPTFKKGDIVRYTGEFLRNIGMFAGGPINGEVDGLSEFYGNRLVLHVTWSDGTKTHVLASNVEHDPRVKR